MPKYNRMSMARRRLLGSLVLYSGELHLVQDLVITALGAEQGEAQVLGRALRHKEVIAGYMFINHNVQQPPYHEDPDIVRHFSRRYQELDLTPDGHLMPGLMLNETIRREAERALRANNNPRPRNDRLLDNPSVLELLLRPLGRSDLLRVPQTDKKLNCNSFKLGMVNLRNGCTVHISRDPVRRYSQGLTSENSRTFTIGGDRRVSWNAVLSNAKEFNQALSGEYPPLNEVLKNIADGSYRCRAFSRHMALSLDDGLGIIVLWYKNLKVGHAISEGMFHLGPRYRFLKEDLENKGVKVHG